MLPAQAEIYEQDQNWRQAAQVLVGIPLETGQKQYTVAYKLETYLKIARLYLEDEDPVQGEAYINRAAQLQTQTKDEHLQIIYKASHPAVMAVFVASIHLLSRFFFRLARKLYTCFKQRDKTKDQVLDMILNN